MMCYEQTLGSRALHMRYKDRPESTGAFLADVCADLWFFIIFLLYPSASSSTFKFFASEEFGPPVGEGEFRMSIMHADHAVNRESLLYRSATVYAFAMLALYPIGVPV